ncbi:hypothetical protein HU200_038958 [Digitaria exilis]|uniref:Uncharacterized protein n=1 Tax=Digitaria exilis TaxID=1010633 RepID=A0A835EI11_9POAL|nr:hypothetical protein HU200_038958 [Digitaria exilis]
MLGFTHTTTRVHTSTPAPTSTVEHGPTNRERAQPKPSISASRLAAYDAPTPAHVAMAMGTKKMIGALVLVLLVVGAAEAQVLPIPCCRFDCCDGKPECCGAGPGMAVMAGGTPPIADVDVLARAPAPAGAGRKAGEVIFFGCARFRSSHGRHGMIEPPWNLLPLLLG